MWALDETAIYIVVGTVRREDERILISSFGGVVVVEEVPSLDRVDCLLTALDGTMPLCNVLKRAGASFQEMQELLAALLKLGAIHDICNAWAYFHRVSGNPFVAPPPMTVEEAYGLARWTPERAESYALLPDLAPSAVSEVALRRTSADLTHQSPPLPSASLREALTLATACYSRLNTHRPAASAGAIWPLAIWVVGGNDTIMPILYVDHDTGCALRTGGVNRNRWKALFLPDEKVHNVLTQGAATVVISADSRRICGKYGNRGWRYALIECGAVSQHMALLAAERGVGVRPIGGYFDLPLSRELSSEILPLLTLIVCAWE
jgi:hypothetical protein